MKLGLIKTVDPSTQQFMLVPVINERRFSHSWVIGKSGTGKSTALIRWALDDICNGDGVAVFDPHGDLAEAIIARIPRSRRPDVIWFDPSDFAIGFNIFDTVPEERKAFVASSVTDSIKSVWGYDDLSTPALEQFLYNGARAMMDMPDGTLFSMKFLFTSETYRRRVITHLSDPVIADFWASDFAEHMPEREQRQRTLSTLNKLGTLIADPAIRQCIAQPRNRIDFAEMLANQKIFIASLPQGRLGIEKSALIGSLLMSQLHLAALSRTGERVPFHIYVDECHHFAPGTLAEILSGIRKFGVSMVLSHQYLGQLSEKLRAALIGTAGTTLAFRIGVHDLPWIEPVIGSNNTFYKLHELPPYKAYIRKNRRMLCLDMPDCPYPEIPGAAEKIKRFSLSQLGGDADTLDDKLRRFIRNATAAPKRRMHRRKGW